MPYITKNTLYKIVSEIDLKKEPSPTKSRLEGKNLTLLSKRELQRLALITEILGSEYIPVDRFFLKLKRPEDSYSHIHPERVPSYHSDRMCSALTREYENYEIPVEVREQGAASVKKFRKFFHENIQLFQENRTDFYVKAKQEFHLKKVLTNRDMVEIKTPNSGRGAIQDFNISHLEHDLDEEIAKAEVYKNTSNIHRLTINMYGNLFNPEINDEEQKNILIKWSSLKKEIKSKYITFSMIKNNPDINLDGNFLDALGLNRCSYCHNDKVDLDFSSILHEEQKSF